MEKKYDVFISYSHEDRLIAEGVCGYLEGKKIRCFIDYRDIPKGATWPSAIPPAIRDSGLMLAIFSKNFNASEQTDNEISIAANRKKPILVFRITDDNFDGTKEYFLTKSNWIEAFPDPQKSFGELHRNICILLGMDLGLSNSPKAVDETLEYSQSVEEDSIQKGLKIWEENNGDWELGTYYFRRAAKEGNVNGMFYLAEAYYTGKGIVQSWDDALIWYSRAAELGHVGSIEKLAAIYRYGIGVERNSMRALEYYTDAASNGSGFAMKELGYIYISGELGVQDEKRSKDFYDKAYETLYEQAFGEDSPEAQFALGESYMSGDGVNQSNRQATKMYIRSANHKNAKALNELGRCYLRGVGVSLNKEKGFKLICEAAELGLPRAMNHLAQCYLKGDGIEANIDKYYEWIQRSAECGDADAQFKIATRYYFGEDCVQDFCQARAWLEQAAKSGSLAALFMLGHMYSALQITAEEGRVTGFQLIRQAAIRGYVPAYYPLGAMYEEGEGTEKNQQEAIRWYQSLVDLYNSAKELRQNYIVQCDGAGMKSFNGIEYYAEAMVYAMERLEEFYLNGVVVKQNLFYASELHKSADLLRKEFLHNDNTDEDLEVKCDSHQSLTDDTISEQELSQSLRELADVELTQDNIDKARREPRTDWKLIGKPEENQIDSLLLVLFGPLRNEINFSKVSECLEEIVEDNRCAGLNFYNAYNTFMYNYHCYCQLKGIESRTTKHLKIEECVPYCSIETILRYKSFAHECFISLAEYIGVSPSILKDNLNKDEFILDIAEQISSESLQRLTISVAEINIEEEACRLINTSIFYKTALHQDEGLSIELNELINCFKRYRCLPGNYAMYTPQIIERLFNQ